MIVNETAKRSRALDEHSRAKMGRQGLVMSGARYIEDINGIPKADIFECIVGKLDLEAKAEARG